MPDVALYPLNPQEHAEALQQVYRGVRRYWQMYNISSSPFGQAALDLQEAAEVPGRTLMGIALLPAEGARAASRMVGCIDFRLGFPDEGYATIGAIMVAEPFQRRGIGRAAWDKLAPWLASAAQAHTARAGVEQFNGPALGFFQAIGFHYTGEATRTVVGAKLVRLLYLEARLDNSAAPGA